MKPLLARFIASVAVCLPLVVLIAMATTHEKKRIEVRTSGPTADVVSAIEALDRPDLEVRLSPPAPDGPVLIGVIGIGTLGMALMLWIAATVVTFVERLILKRRM